MSYPRACRGCGSEIRLEVLNPVGGLAEPNHNEADCLSSKLDAERERLKRVEDALAREQELRDSYGSRLETRETELADLEQEAARLRSERDRYRNALALLRDQGL